MIRLFLYALIALAIGAALALLFAAEPGYMLIYFRGYTVEATLGTVVLSLVLLTLLVVGVLRLLRFVNPFKLFERRTWDGIFNSRYPELVSAKGLQLLLLGHNEEAYKLLIENAERVDDPSANYLAASIAAWRMNNRISWNYCLDQAEKKAPPGTHGTRSLRAMLEARSGDKLQALAMLQSLQRLAPGSPLVLTQLRDLYLELGDWANLEALLPEFERYKVLDAPQRLALAEQVQEQSLLRAAQTGIESLRMAWHDLPKQLRHSERLTGRYIQLLLQFEQDAEAGELLTKQLKHAWSDNLIGMMGYLKSANPQQQLNLLEGWLRQHPGNPVLLLTLGRVSLRNQLWGKAREYFEQALRVSQATELTAEISAELGRLLEHMGEREKSLVCYQRAMGLLDRKLPQLPMPERTDAADFSQRRLG